MKNLTKLIVLASSVALLAGCRSKADWTEDEKKVFEDYLLYELPMLSSKNLTLQEVKDDDVVITAVGDTASKEEIEDYVKVLTNKENGYIEEDVSEDLEEVVSLKNAHQLRKGDGKTVAEQVIAVGLDKDDKLNVVMTVAYTYFGMASLVDGSFYVYGSGVDIDMLAEANDEAFKFANAYVEDEKEVFPFTEGDFVYPAEGSSWDAFGVTEYSYVFPWTNGNFYSDEFNYINEMTFANASASESVAFATKLEKNGYTLHQAATESNPYDTYKKEVSGGTALISYVYEDEFFTDGTPAMSIAYMFAAK